MAGGTIVKTADGRGKGEEEEEEEEDEGRITDVLAVFADIRPLLKSPFKKHSRK